MQLFALQTNRKKTQEELLSPDEELVVTVRYSGFIYVFGIVMQLFITVVAIVLGVLCALFTPFDIRWVIGILGVIWMIFGLFPILYKYIHWYYSVVFVTRKRIVIVDQVSIIRRSVTELSLENFSSVAARTQFANIFPFGILRFTMREGNGEPVILHYVPHAEMAAKVISDVVTAFQAEA